MGTLRPPIFFLPSRQHKMDAVKIAPKTVSVSQAVKVTPLLPQAGK